MTPCVHASTPREGSIFCRLLSGRVESSRCQSCQWHTPGTALPVLASEVTTSDEPPRSPCQFLGDLSSNEPCNCGATMRLPIHNCQHPEIKLGRAIIQLTDWDRFNDPDIKPLLPCCATCPRHSPRVESHRRPRPPLKLDTIRIGLASYGFYTGGVEEWFRNLISGTTDPSIQYTAIGVHEPDQIGTTRSGIPLVPHDELHHHCDLILGWSTELHHLKDWPGRIIYIAHGQTSWTGDCVNRHLGLADAIVAVSEASRAVINAPASDVQVIRNGVDLDRLITPAQRSVTSPTLGYLGRWSAEKRPHLVAEAARLIGCRAAFLVPTDKQHAARQELELYEIPIDWYTTEHLQEFLACVSCLVIPSEHEGGPLVLAEAWASGIPVACTQVGMLPELEQLHGPLTIPLSNPPTPTELQSLLTSIDPTVTAKAHQLAITQLAKSRMSTDYTTLFRQLIPCATDGG